MVLVGCVIPRSLERKIKKDGNGFPSFLLLTLLLPNQIRNNHVSVAIVFLVAESENVRTIAVTENVMIYKKERPRLWIGYPLNVCNLLKDRHLQALVGRAEFDVSHTDLLLRPSHNRRLLRGFEV